MTSDTHASRRSRRILSSRSLAVFAGLGGLALSACTPVHTLRITNTSNVPMEYAQAMGDETNRQATGNLAPGESVLVTIREGEAIKLPDALTIEILGD